MDRVVLIVSVQFQFGSFGAFLIFDDLASRKRLIIRRAKWKKNWSSGGKYLVYVSTFDC